MPRTSKKAIRKKKAQECCDYLNERENPLIQPIYRTAVYVRLSLEDIRKKISDSIGTQKAMLEIFISTQPDLQIYKIYEDVNYTGTNFNRPAFSQMIKDLEAGLIDCIVVKDLSRFGRNFKVAGYFLGRMFPERQIRFISVSDNYDTLTASIDESSLIVPLKNLMNEIYARDVSKKVKSSFRVKQQRGEFCGAFAPYGYIKVGPSLVIDEETAPIVKMIFQWRFEGVEITAIVQRLNDMKILPPSRYRFEKGITKSKNHEETLVWYKSAVKRILKNPGYTGDMVQARYKSNLMNGGGIIETNKNEWIVVPNTHPAIIDKHTFSAVQKKTNG